MNRIIYSLLVLLSQAAQAQITFEEGYYIDNEGRKVNCYIKNVEWKNNPVSFEYKINHEKDVLRANIDEVQAFRTGDLNYIRAKVNIDRSSAMIGELSKHFGPDFNEETLFLKEIVRGDAKLYSYIDGNLSRFFYQMGDGPIVQLIYKKYRPENNIVEVNESYKQTLINKLSNEAISVKDIMGVMYREKDLKKVFYAYNEFRDPDYTRPIDDNKSIDFDLYLRPGVNFSKLKLSNSVVEERTSQFGASPSIRFGLEAEFFLPFNKNKWAALVEPTFQQFSEEDNLAFNETVTTSTEIEYQSIELPVGVRYYLFLNEKSTLFTNALLLLDFPIKGTVIGERSDLVDLEMTSRPSFALGAGYNYNSRFSLELRYLINREVLGKYTFWNSSYRTFSIILGYNLF